MACKMAYAKTTGVYSIYCSGNQKLYIGSAVSIKGRWAVHRCALRKSEHTNKHLQNSFNKYGEDSFEFSVVELCSKDELILREQFWMDFYKCYDPSVGMNNSPTASTTIGFRHSEATKRKISEMMKGVYQPHLKLANEARKGKPGHSRGKPGRKWSEEEKFVCSLARKGQKAWNKGIPHTKESKMKIAIGVSKARRIINEDARKIICSLREDKVPYTAMAKFMGVSFSQCQKIYEYDKMQGTDTSRKN